MNEELDQSERRVLELMAVFGAVWLVKDGTGSWDQAVLVVTRALARESIFPEEVCKEVFSRLVRAGPPGEPRRTAQEATHALLALLKTATPAEE